MSWTVLVYACCSSDVNGPLSTLRSIQVGVINHMVTRIVCDRVRALSIDIMWIIQLSPNPYLCALQLRSWLWVNSIAPSQVTISQHVWLTVGEIMRQNVTQAMLQILSLGQLAF